ncbi:MAG: glycerate kinase, partial [Elusimicrobiaceae bacterium]|nr:glycerate kinase [Elusimicrobiaceae bacterium]
MKILIAPNEFKGTLTSNEACKIIAKEAKKIGHEVIEMPISDGGDGFLNAIKVAFSDGKIHNIKVKNPYFKDVSVRILTSNNSAYIETAEICGLRKAKKLSPLIASSYGVGEAIKKALDMGVKKIYIGLGGVITNDGGVGLANALGVKFLNKKKRELKPGVRDLKNLFKIDVSGLDKRVKGVKFYALSDVRNPLLGKTGSAVIYG